jgi:Rrf2 family protein
VKVSALEEYGLRCILRVAADYQGETPMTAGEVAEAESISVPYAQKILRLLSRADLIESRRGVGGGYTLARQPERITVGDVIRALDATFETSDVCTRHTGEDDVCAHSGSCAILPMWNFIEDFISRTLDNLPLSTLLNGTEAVSTKLGNSLNQPDREMYCPVADISAGPEST